MKIEEIIHAINNKMTPFRVGLVAAIFMLQFSLGVVNSQPHGLYSWYKLSIYGQEADAVVTGTQPEIHRTCYFQYSVNAKRYSGSDQGCNFATGETITILYLPADPSFSTSASPFQQFLFLALVPILMSVLGGVGAAKIFSRYRAKKI